MRFKFTIFLVVLNIIVFGLITYLNKSAEQLDDSMGGLSGQIGRELVEADQIELRGSMSAENWVLQREGSNWRITEPIQWAANYFAVSRILNQLQFIEEQASFTVDEIAKSGQTLADYGLKEPSLELIISEGDESLKLSIGTTTEIGNNVYMLGPDQEQIFVVSRRVRDGLLVNLDDLKNREIFDIPVFEIQELSLQINSSTTSSNGDLKVRLANTAGNWRFETPLAAEADPALVSNTINTLAAVKVGRFLEPDAGDPVTQGLENPFMRVTLHGNKRRQTLYIGNKDPFASEGQAQYFARFQDNPAVFTVEATPFEELMEAQESLRERNFMAFESDDLNTIHIAENGRQIRLQKIETGDWQVLESTGDSDVQPRRADPIVMQKIITDLQDLRAKTFALDAPTGVDLEIYGFNQPRRAVTLYFDNKQPLLLELAHPGDENLKLYARTGQNDFIYEVERRPSLQLLPLNALHYRNRTIDKLPQAAVIRSLTLKNLQTDEQIFEYQLEEGGIWEAKLADLDAKTAKSINTLLKTVRSFEVETYLYNQYSDAYRVDSEKELPWAFSLDAEILLPGGDDQQIRRIQYVFTERLSGTVQVGGSKTHNTVFQLTQKSIDALYDLTDTMKLPPESLGEPVPDPESIAPVPEPEPPSDG
ncbi:MAG: DUF4340 domain-containing protein [Verrucomicrobiota bacterium]